MPGWLKALIIIAVVVVVFVVGVIVAGAVWWSRNKDALMGKAKEVAVEGKDFGNHSDNQGCVDEMIVRYKKEPGFSTALSTSIFLRSCLDESRPTPGFCESVPGEFEIMKSAEWRTEQCRRAGLSSDSYCQSLFKPVQDFCKRGGSSDRKSNSQ
jgi:hypothetical protein